MNGYIRIRIRETQQVVDMAPHPARAMIESRIAERVEDPAPGGGAREETPETATSDPREQKAVAREQNPPKRGGKRN
ncbi:MAG TPA: hypothetical protein VH022_14485 [Candidatus Acidoferrum sp.]|jgi:hypothetical protein|nr:hypothetical protein [Candidatus Acidoferrum sp.]